MIKAPISADLVIDGDEVILNAAVDETCAELIDNYSLRSLPTSSRSRSFECSKTDKETRRYWRGTQWRRH